MSASTYTIENIQKSLYSGVAFPLPAGYYLGLHSGDPTAAGTALEFTGNGYVRVAFTATVGAGPIFTATNDDNILFTASGGDWSEATYFSVWDDENAGNMLDYSAIGVPFINLDGESSIVNTGDLTINQV